MKSIPTILLLVVALAARASAHRLDEYLQATIVSIQQDRVAGSMRLLPGVAVSASVIAATDMNGDSIFSKSEQRTYAQQVLRDLSLSIDGHKLTPHLETVSFPSAADIREGLGEIQIEFTADLPSGGSRRSFVIQNHHQPAISVYLMNCLAPEDQHIRLIAQSRNITQSYYRIDYAQDQASQTLFRTRIFLALAPLAGVPNTFRLGMRHIAEGTDHLLFLITLLLPAPMIAVRARWAAIAGIRHSLVRIFRIVSAFTIGHSITLALGASGVVSLPSRTLEVLIAVSILISAVHALHPVFPGREPMIAGSFGLIHGLAFASTLQGLGVGAWQRIASILGFNLGIEAMQLIVVAAFLPSLLILSRTPNYKILRCTGSLLAGVASLGWILERSLGLNVSVDLIVNHVAESAGWMAAALFISSVLSWLLNKLSRGKNLAAHGGNGIGRVGSPQIRPCQESRSY